MDLYNIKEIGKSSRINDEFWYEAWLLSTKLLAAIRSNNDTQIIQLLRNPKLFKGRA